MKIKLFLNSDPSFPRFLESYLTINGEELPLESASLSIDAKKELLTIQIPLSRVIICSDASETIDKSE